jgi:acetyl-CoA C-acetyltransferase
MEKTVIVSAARTPFGRFGGGLKDVGAVDLGGIALRGALERTDVAPEQVEHVVMGMVLQGGAGQIPSRQAARKAGLPWETTSETINKVCASGLRAVALADQQIRLGEAEVVLAGGMESMSNAVFALPALRSGQRMGHTPTLDLMVHDGLWCAFHDRHMAVHGSVVAEEYGVTREEQDLWALRSQQRASRAVSEGIFDEEIVPVEIPQRKGEPLLVRRDEAPRPDTTLDGLAKLPPLFMKDGTVTAGNAPGVNDGAAALMLMSEKKAAELGLKPLAAIGGYATVGAEAAYLGTVPGLATLKLLQKTGLKMEQIDLFEANEAFAAVSLVSGKVAGWDPEKVNVNGGAIALGHPIGASGARILITLIRELRCRGGGRGIAAICSGAAQGDAILVEV